MARCPSCGGVVQAPAKAWTYLEWDQNKTSLIKKDVGVFECQNCRTRFPAVAGKEAVLIVPVQKVQSLRTAAEEARATVEKLKAELALKEDQNATLKENVAMLELQIRAIHLEFEVDKLKEEKAKLEEGIVTLA